MADRPNTNEETKKPGFGKGIRLRTINAVIVVLAAVVAIIFLQAVRDTNESYTTLENAAADYVLCEQAVSDMKAGSNFLTIEVRTFVVTQDTEYLDEYFTEVNETRRRQNAVETLEEILEDEPLALRDALDESNELMKLELYAMRLVAEAKGYQEVIANHLADVELTAADRALSPDEKIQKATDIVFGDEYMDHVSRIESDIAASKDTLIDEVGNVQQKNKSTLHMLLTRQQALAILLFIVFVALAAIIVLLVLWPLSTFSNHIKDNDSLPKKGAAELRSMADAYNVMYAENMKNHDTLRRKAEHDHLTGLYNRSVFERLLQVHEDDSYALMLVDADYFKEINDTLGHDKGDEVLKKIAGLLGHTFRTSDYPCRIGGDEFAVFMTEMTEDLRYVVEAKARSLMAGLQDESDGLPAITLSIGVAFGDGSCDGSQVFKHADQALYKVKEAGRNGLGFYGEE